MNDLHTQRDRLNERLLNPAVTKSQILDIFRRLTGGPVGFDHERLKKAACVEKLLADWPLDAIENEATYLGIPQAGAMPAASQASQAHAAPAAQLTGSMDANAVAQQIAGLFAAMAQSSVSEAKVQAMVDTAIASAVSRLVNRIEVVRPELPDIDVGLQHASFPKLLKACNARLPDGSRLNVWLAGPAGSGKTTAARSVAKALELKFYFNGAISQPFELIGFTNATGGLVRTPFRDAWEHGGVYLFDEVDSSNPNAVTAFNAALANGVCAFPDRIVDRHPDCVVIAGANTVGNGATSDYVGRMKQDKAFLDRFAMLDWPIDEKLELATGPNPEWTRRVQAVRKRVEARGIKGHMVTPRATYFGASLLAAGLEMETVENMVLRKGLTEEQWTQIR